MILSSSGVIDGLLDFIAQFLRNRLLVLFQRWNSGRPVVSLSLAERVLKSAREDSNV